MSKFVIILFAVFFGSVVNAASVSDSEKIEALNVTEKMDTMFKDFEIILEAAKNIMLAVSAKLFDVWTESLNKIDNETSLITVTVVDSGFFPDAQNVEDHHNVTAEIHAMTEEFQEVIDISDKIMFGIGANLSNARTKFLEKIVNVTLWTTETVNLAISNFTDNAHGDNITKCLKPYKELILRLAGNVIASTERCIYNKMTTARYYVEDIEMLCGQSYVNHTATLWEAQQYGGNINCTKKASAWVAQLSSNATTDLNTTISKLKSWSNKFIQSMDDCEPLNEMANLLEEASTVVDIAEHCIEEINEYAVFMVSIDDYDIASSETEYSDEEWFKSELY